MGIITIQIKQPGDVSRPKTSDDSLLRKDIPAIPSTLSTQEQAMVSFSPLTFRKTKNF